MNWESTAVLLIALCLGGASLAGGLAVGAKDTGGQAWEHPTTDTGKEASASSNGHTEEVSLYLKHMENCVAVIDELEIIQKYFSYGRGEKNDLLISQITLCQLAMSLAETFQGDEIDRKTTKRGYDSIGTLPLGLKRGYDSIGALPLGLKRGYDSIGTLPLGLRRGYDSIGTLPLGLKRGYDSIGTLPLGLKRGYDSIGALPLGLKRGYDSFKEDPLSPKKNYNNVGAKSNSKMEEILKDIAAELEKGDSKP